MRTRTLIQRTTLCFAFSVLAVTTAQAGVRMNSMCYLQNKEKAEVTAFNPTKNEISKSKMLKKYRTNVEDEDLDTKFRVASLSKILTTHWATARLGPDYRFQTKIYVTPGVSETSCNLHFEGDMDPYMGREMLGAIFPQLRTVLKERKCAKVDTISYDENFRVFLNVMNHQKSESFGWNNPAALVRTSQTDVDFKGYLQHRSQLKYDAKKVGPISKERYQDYLKTVPYKAYAFKSRPLHMMLRDFNKYSFNYPPELLFLKLGGADAYARFINNRLGFTLNAVEMYNGSGYPIHTQSSKVYNLVSCSALVQIIQDLDKLLVNGKNSRAFQMADVMAVGGSGETYSTFKKLYESSTFTNTLVAKTGTADFAITFGGMLATNEGHLYFAVLTRPDAGSADSARFFIRELMQTMANRQTLARFPYQQIGDMSPTDSAATLVEVDKKETTEAIVQQPSIAKLVEKTKAQIFLNLKQQ